MKKTLSLLLSLVLMLSLALPASAAETEYPTLEGGVTEIQKYGNIVLDIDPADLKDGGYTYGDLLTVTVNGTGYDMPLCTNYSDVDTGALVLRDSEGVLIAAINMGDFATSNGLAAKVTAEDGSYTWEFPEGQSLESITVSISMKEQGGYYDQYLIHQLTRTDERADYASDAVFANFRNVAVGDLGENAFFRSSSPVNNELGRASYADDLAEAGGIPVIVYNVPSRTGLNIAPETALELSKHPLINGIKEASGNISQVAKIAALCGDELNIYSGNDDQVVPLLALGGKGVISVVSNVAPELVHNCCQAFFDGDTAKARDLQLEMLPLSDALFCEVNPIPIKYAMNLLGWEAGEWRLPLVEPSEAHQAQIENTLRAAGLIQE